MSKLDYGQKHLLRLALRDGDQDGWSKVSNPVWPFIDGLPSDLRETKTVEGQHFVRLTDQGKAIAFYT